MAPNIKGTATIDRASVQTEPDGFDLDITLLEVADPAGLTNLTDDNCGTTCGACTTNVA
ncbi:FxLD family lanthipeptide [Streptomyces sp. NPDC054933]